MATHLSSQILYFPLSNISSIVSNHDSVFLRRDVPGDAESEPAVVPRAETAGPGDEIRRNGES